MRRRAGRREEGGGENQVFKLATRHEVYAVIRTPSFIIFLCRTFLGLRQVRVLSCLVSLAGMILLGMYDDNGGEVGTGRDSGLGLRLQIVVVQQLTQMAIVAHSPFFLSWLLDHLYTRGQGGCRCVMRTLNAGSSSRDVQALTHVRRPADALLPDRRAT